MKKMSVSILTAICTVVCGVLHCLSCWNRSLSLMLPFLPSCPALMLFHEGTSWWTASRIIYTIKKACWEDMKISCHDYPVQNNCDRQFYPDNCQNVLKTVK